MTTVVLGSGLPHPHAPFLPCGQKGGRGQGTLRSPSLEDLGMLLCPEGGCPQPGDCEDSAPGGVWTRGPSPSDCATREAGVSSEALCAQRLCPCVRSRRGRHGHRAHPLGAGGGKEPVRRSSLWPAALCAAGQAGLVGAVTRQLRVSWHTESPGALLRPGLHLGLYSSNRGFLFW